MWVMTSPITGERESSAARGLVGAVSRLRQLVEHVLDVGGVDGVEVFVGVAGVGAGFAGGGGVLFAVEDDDRVVAVHAGDDVASGAAFDEVVAGVAEEVVVAAAAADRVVAAVAVDELAGVGADDRVVPFAAEDAFDVVADERRLAFRAVVGDAVEGNADARRAPDEADRVHVGAAEVAVVAVAATDGVGAGLAFEGVVAG